MFPMGPELRDNSGTPPPIAPRNHLPIFFRVGRCQSLRDLSRDILGTQGSLLRKLAQAEDSTDYPVFI